MFFETIQFNLKETRNVKTYFAQQNNGNENNSTYFEVDGSVVDRNTKNKINSRIEKVEQIFMELRTLLVIVIL